jgi:hypothetical protein
MASHPQPLQYLCFGMVSHPQPLQYPCFGMASHPQPLQYLCFGMASHPQPLQYLCFGMASHPQPSQYLCFGMASHPQPLQYLVFPQSFLLSFSSSGFSTAGRTTLKTNRPMVLQTIKPATVSVEHNFYCGGIKPTSMYTFVALKPLSC